MNVRSTNGNGRKSLTDREGAVIIPLLFMLSLLSLLSVSAIKVGGVGNSTSEALVDRSQARMAALSGVEIAYRRLAVDTDYTGETCTPFRSSACSIDVTVSDLGDREYRVVSRGEDDQCQCTVRTRVKATEYVLRYPLCVGNDLELQNKSGILGDVYVGHQISGKTSAVISGNVYLDGPRSFLADAVGDIVSIDGVDTPKIEGDAYADAPDVKFPAVDMSGLRALASAAGQIFTGTVKFEEQTFEGVVYIEGAGSRPYFDDVVIKGLLVCDGDMEIRIENGMLKIHADENICPNTALLAPDSILWVDPNAFLDIYGLSYFESVDFQGGGTFTGPVIVLNDLVSLPNSYFYCQFPSTMKEFSASGLSWSEFIMVEKEFEEL